MTKLSCGPLWKENNKWENVGLCLGFRAIEGLRGAGSPPLRGSGQCLREFFFWTLY